VPAPVEGAGQREARRHEGQGAGRAPVRREAQGEVRAAPQGRM